MTYAQSKFSFMPGIFYNGTGLTEDVKGFGAILGLEYKKSQDHFFSIELRTKYGYYSYDDGTKWRENSKGEIEPPKNPEEARIEYDLFSPQIGVIPKLHFYFDDSFSIFLQNEFSIGLMAGKFRYMGSNKKVGFTETIFSYNIGAGVEYRLNRCTLVGSLAYSTLNFRNKINKHKPANYQNSIPNQHAGLLVDIILKFPL